jgi:hypothetical protein
MPLGTPQCEKVVALSLHSFFRKNKQFQILRLQVKETCKHSSGTQTAFSKIESTALRPLFKQDFLISPPAARGGYAARDKEKT